MYPLSCGPVYIFFRIIKISVYKDLSLTDFAVRHVQAVTPASFMPLL